MWSVFLTTCRECHSVLHGQLHAKFFSAITILLLNFPILLLQHFLTCPASFRPFWIRFLLLLSPAIEFSFIAAVHPTTRAFTTCLDTPDVSAERREILMQIFILNAVELLTQHCMRHLITFPHPSELLQRATPNSQAKVQEDDDTANALALDFMNPRAALLIAIALISTTCSTTGHTGKLHSKALIVGRAR